MPGHCCHHCDEPSSLLQARYRKLLWIALAINFIMFGVEIWTGLRGRSVSLLADSLDFLGDAANYGISLFVLGLSRNIRARASRFKAVSMIAFGLWILGLAIWYRFSGRVPSAPTMGAVGTCALLANGTVAALLLRYRDGDSNMLSVWLCTRNDVLGNIAVVLAALGVVGTKSAWPDMVVAVIMSTLALASAAHILRRSSAELRDYADERPVATQR